MSKLCTCGLGLPEGEGNTPVTCDANGNLVTNVDSINCAALPAGTPECSQDFVCVNAQVRSAKQAMRLASSGTEGKVFNPDDTPIPLGAGTEIFLPPICFPAFQNGPCFYGQFGMDYYLNIFYENTNAGKFAIDPQVSPDGGVTYASLGLFYYVTGPHQTTNWQFSYSGQANVLAPGQFSSDICFRVVVTGIQPGGTLYGATYRMTRSDFWSMQ